MPYIPEPGSEARWTEPRPDCPHPERWTSDDQDSTEYEVSDLVAGFVTALQPDLVLETGTAWGQTAEKIGRALKANGQGRLVSLEPDPHRCAFSRTRCFGLPVDVEQIASLDYTPESTVDFAWFDSLFHLRAPEFRRFRPYMTTRTIVGFHDTGPHHPLRPQIEELVTEGLIRPMYLPTPRGVCFAEVL